MPRSGFSVLHGVIHTFLPLFHEHSLLLELPWAAHLVKTSSFEKRTACVIETMLMMWRFSQMKKLQREINQQTKHKPRQTL